MTTTTIAAAMLTAPAVDAGTVPPAPTSRAAVVGGVSGAGVLIWLLDRLLVDGGEQAASMLTRLSPILGPAWASWPILVLLVVLAWVAADKWRAGQAARAAEAARATAATDKLTGGVAEVATGLAGLRVEVHSLRGALQDHADRTDARLRSHEAGLGELKAEVTHVRGRVDILERPVAASRKPSRRS